MTATMQRRPGRPRKNENKQAPAPQVAQPEAAATVEEEANSRIPHDIFIAVWQGFVLDDEGNVNLLTNPETGEPLIQHVEDVCDYLQVSYDRIPSFQSRASAIRSAERTSPRYFPLRSLTSRERGSRVDAKRAAEVRDLLLRAQGETLTAEGQIVPLAQPASGGKKRR